MTEINVAKALQEAAAALDALRSNKKTIEAIVAAGNMLADSFRAGGRVFSCGNGGSMCDAMHFAEELSGKFRRDRPGLAATAISDPSHISCVGNDYGYEEVFARYLAAHGRQGDVLLAISTSGTSKNVLRAVEEAQKRQMQCIALTGREDTLLEANADITVITPGGKFADRVQELHIKVIHILIELVERSLFDEDYK